VTLCTTLGAGSARVHDDCGQSQERAYSQSALGHDAEPRTGARTALSTHCPFSTSPSCCFPLPYRLPGSRARPNPLSTVRVAQRRRTTAEKGQSSAAVLLLPPTPDLSARSSYRPGNQSEWLPGCKADPTACRAAGPAPTHFRRSGWLRGAAQRRRRVSQRVLLLPPTPDLSARSSYRPGNQSEWLPGCKADKRNACRAAGPAPTHFRRSGWLRGAAQRRRRVSQRFRPISSRSRRRAEDRRKDRAEYSLPLLDLAFLLFLPTARP
jgi:hypothetical protein